MSNIVSDDIAKMVHLYSYNSETTSSNRPSSIVEYHAQGADGKTYGILKEGTKYYIKVAPVKDTKVLAEDYDYIGGITNKRRYEYDSYSKASKQFDLKMMSLNEAYENVYDSNDYRQNNQEQSEWQIKETKEMRAEIDRYNKMVANVDKIITEGSGSKSMTKKPKGVGFGSATSGKAKKGDAFSEKAKHELNQKTGECKDAKCADDTFDENPFSTEKINKMGEHANYKTADKTFKHKATARMNEQTALCSRENPDYMDMSNGTHKGSTAPYGTCKSCKCDSGTVCEDECFDDDNLNNPKSGTGCAPCKSNPWANKVNEETILPDEAAGFDTDDDLTNNYNDDTPFGYEGDDFANEENDFGEFGKEDGTDEFDDEDFYEDDTVSDGEDDLDSDDIDLDVDTNLNEGISDYPYVDGNENEYDEFDEYSDNDLEFSDDKEDEPMDVEFDEEPMDSECYLNEGEIDYWGKHPAYGKSAFTLPDDVEINRWGRDWNDSSAKGGKYGQSKGKNSPYDEDLLVDSIVNSILKKKTLEERKVLKVPKSKDDGMADDFNDSVMPSFSSTSVKDTMPQPDKQTISNRNMDQNGAFTGPSIENPYGEGGEFDSENGDMDKNATDDVSYENDFDAGVDANEEDDPEKYLQQLTGKLCDKLKKFNDEKPKPDVAMCKYIAGMVLAQCVKGLGEKQKDEILSKLTKEDENDDDHDNDGMEEDNNGDNENSNDFDGENDNDFNDKGNEMSGNNMNESRRVFERLMMNVSNDLGKRTYKKKTNNNKSYKMTPYTPPMFN